MEDERGRLLEQAREFLLSLERASAYEVLGVTRETPSSEIHKMFMQAIAQRSRAGYSQQEIAQARDQVKDTQKRLMLDTQTLDEEQWLQMLDALRNRYALFDFLGDLYKR